jgi:hypothetical protein
MSADVVLHLGRRVDGIIRGRNIARISSPMVLITVPRLRSVDPRISSTQVKIMSRAW